MIDCVVRKAEAAAALRLRHARRTPASAISGIPSFLHFFIVHFLDVLKVNNNGKRFEFSVQSTFQTLYSAAERYYGSQCSDDSAGNANSQQPLKTAASLRNRRKIDEKSTENWPKNRRKKAMNE